jgi:hypothetical protein
VKCQTASILDRQGQGAGTGEHHGLCDSVDVDVTVDAGDRPGVFAGDTRVVV